MYRKIEGHIVDKKEDIIKRFKEIHGDKYDYSLIEHIHGQREKIPIICRDHGVFYQTSKAHLHGQGCPTCGFNYAHTRTKCNWKHFLEEAEKRFPGHYEFPKIQDEYVNSHSKITVRCKIDGNEFVKIACDFITSPSGGCKVCLLNRHRTYYTYEELQNKTNVHIVPFDGKVESRDKITAYCEEHGTYELHVTTVLDGKGQCRSCSNRQTNEHFEEKKEEFLRLDKEIYDGKFIYDINSYQGWSVPMRFTCRDCGNVISRSPMIHVIYGFRECNKCGSRDRGQARIKTNEQFICESKSIFGEDTFDYSKCHYTKSNEKVELICNECGKSFLIEANTHLSKHQGCPHHFRNRSCKEKELEEFVRSLGANPYVGYRRALKNNYELDLYDDERKIAIEFDGIFWHNENNKPKKYHLNKTVECEEQGIRLIHIFEDEWIDPVKQNIWKSMISHLYGKYEEKIYARKCIIKEVENKDATEFLNFNHLQGYCNSKTRIGLYYGGELVSLMTFGTPRHFIGGNRHDIELLRFCNKTNTIVIGAASRLLKYYIKKYHPKNIVSYADRRWSCGHLYEVLGFKLYNKSVPNYYYVIGSQRKNRFNFRKSILVKKYGCPMEMSEHEFCLSKQWYRIYDCGCLCYELILDDTQYNTKYDVITPNNNNI